MDRILRKKAVLTALGISDATLWRWERINGFPQRIRLGGNTVGWSESEIQEWIERQKAERERIRESGSL